jgi:hypothetical protein
MLLLMFKIALHPFLHSRPIEDDSEVPHGNRIGEDVEKRLDIVLYHGPHRQSLGLNHDLKYV